MKARICFAALALCSALFAQPPVSQGGIADFATVQVGTPDNPTPVLQERPSVYLSPEGAVVGTPIHPVHVVARHPKAGCDDTATCGDVFADEWTHNIRVSAGTTWQYNQMAGSTAAVGTYIALTNTAITPAMADTSLSGEIVTNGLSRALATPTNNSTTLTVPSAPTSAVVGSAGSTSYYYWLETCAQTICTTPSASVHVTTANATLSTANYVQLSFTGQTGASYYQICRTTSSSTPSGSTSCLIGGSPACTLGTSATAPSCTWNDVSNTVTSITVPGSNLTNFGTYTLVYTWTCATSAQQAQAFAVLNASSSGTMIFEGTFTQVSLNVGDTLQLTESVYF
jgi:hypothetical protein